jgi:hypothetical protein
VPILEKAQEASYKEGALLIKAKQPYKILNNHYRLPVYRLFQSPLVTDEYLCRNGQLKRTVSVSELTGQL